jgi:Flp pilus assembly protein TadG
MSAHAWTSFAAVRKFRNLQDGLAAVEFGILLPVLMLMLFGILEIGLALSVDRKLSIAVTSVADLVAREEKATTASLDSIMAISKHLMNPYDPSKLKLTVKALRNISATEGQIQWSHAFQGGASPSKCSKEALKSEVLGPGAVGISVEGEYNYTPLITKYFIKNAIKFNDNAMMSPRLGNVVLNSDNMACPN